MQGSCEISVIVPVYNGEQYLDACVESVIASEGFDRWELILVDDGSTDGSAVRMRAFAERYPNIRCISYGANRGPSAARNAGLAQARGSYVSFVDSDDCVEPGYLFRLLERARKTRAQAVFAGYCIWQDGRAVPAERTVLDGGLYTGGEYLDRRMDMEDQHNYIWAALFERQFLTEQKIRFCEELGLYEDILFTAQVCARAQRVAAVPEYGYCYRVHSGSLVNSGVKLRDVEQSVLLLEKLKEALLLGENVGRLTIQVLSMCLYYIGKLTEDGILSRRERAAWFRRLTALKLLPLLKLSVKTRKERMKWILWKWNWRLFYPLVRK